MPKINTTHQKKRHGLHHKRSKHYHNVYLPYLPALLMIIASLFLSGLRVPIAQQGTLAYATEMSVNNLLSSTNKQRLSYSRSTLQVNEKLNQAAQAKAEDMVKRNYWSHNTPDGKEPWIFIDSSGYAYRKAGENLAYGFRTSTDTVVGWMNSASHKANLLDSSFTEVGFGFANSSNYQSKGEETVVVAMYGQPLSESPNPNAQAPFPPDSQPLQPEVVQPDTLNAAEQTPVTTDQFDSSERSEQPITRIQALTAGRAPWALFAVGLLSGTAVSTMFINHGLRLRRLLIKGERFVLHHPALDINMISLLILALVLSQSIGVIL